MFLHFVVLVFVFRKVKCLEVESITGSFVNVFDDPKIIFEKEKILSDSRLQDANQIQQRPIRFYHIFEGKKSKQNTTNHLKLFI